MFNSNFNKNFQNPYPDQTNNMNYDQGMNMLPAESIPNSLTYPSALPAVAMPNIQPPQPNINYAEGGEVRKSRKKQSKFPNLYPSLAEMIREQGGEEDSILAHINPLEAQILGLMANGGKINPTTGLPQFGLFNKPGKWLKGSLGGAGGAILGNMILPGIGGIIGGALGGAAGSAVRGRKDYLQAGLRGGAMGAALPSAASLLGSGASKLGMNSAGNFLSNYGAENSILSSLGLGGGGVSAGGGDGAISGRSSLGNMISGTGNVNGIGTLGEAAKEGSWYDKWLEPKNLLTAAALGGSFMNRPKEKKEKSPEQLANEAKRLYNGVRLSRAEIEADEAAEFLKKQVNYRLRHNLAGGESLSAPTMYRKVNTPDEYKKHGRWLGYYPNQDFSGNPLPMKMGGQVPEMQFEEEETQYPSGLGVYLKGHTGGQDDKRPMKLPEGSYIIDASTVSDLGDGNSEAGKKQLDALVSDGEYYMAPKIVSNMGKGNNNLGAKKLDEMVKNIRQHKRGGSINLPPKAKSLASYMTR